jgi:16S rRNA (guanine527-N7)-methyltransferase
MSSQLVTSLQFGADALGVTLIPAQVTTLLDFIVLLERWNRAYNLTAVRDLAQMVPRHLLDSLSIMPFIRGESLLDVGSGAGFPGLVLAVAMPHLQVTLLDPALKRTRFLAHAVRELAVPNVHVERARIEDFMPDTCFDTVTSRATVALDVLIHTTLSLLSGDGRLVAMLGKAPTAQASQIRPPWNICIAPLKVPGIDVERHAAIVSRSL